MANSYDVTRLPFQPKQQIVNWNSCTADEILDYEEEGQEVPEQYLRWAEEMSAAMNVQDDVTYEMAHANEGGDGQGGNAAQNFRTELADSGVSLKQQGKIFITESEGKEEETLASIEQMGPLLNQTQDIGDDAEKISDETKTKLQEIKEQVDAQVADKNNWKTRIFGSREDRGELKGLQAVAGALANAAATQLNGLNDDLNNIQATVNEGAAISKLATDYGSETVAIGKELTGGNVIKKIFGIFNGKQKVGREAIQQGTETQTVGQQGSQIAQETADANGISIQNVGKAASNTATGIEGDAGAQNDGGEQAAPNETGATKTASAKPEEKSETEIANANPSEILTDPNEIIKRKERRGLT